MYKQKSLTENFALCIKSEDHDLLTPGKLYRVLPDERAAKSNYLRVVDNEGEDYLYPAQFFSFVGSAKNPFRELFEGRELLELLTRQSVEPRKTQVLAVFPKSGQEQIDPGPLPIRSEER